MSSSCAMKSHWSFTLPPTKPTPNRTSRCGCLLVTCFAFVTGVIVGVGVTRISYTPAPPALAPWVLDTSRLNYSHSVGNNSRLNNSLMENEITFDGNFVDGIYWSDFVEQMLPTSFTEDQVDKWRSFVKGKAIVRLQEGCGRMQNRRMTFENGTESCARYRQNLDQIQGEIFSFFLSRLLGMTNAPPASLAVVRYDDRQWLAVRHQLTLSQWSDLRPVVVTRFVDGLEPAYIPPSLRTASRRLHPSDVTEEDPRRLAELVQWSDLIIFDYLTANLDRVVNNLYNLQWNPTMMEAPAHNLAVHAASGLLVFLDNESGLLHGYRLLEKYEPFHASLLTALCVFRRSTVRHIQALVTRNNVGQLLRQELTRHESDARQFLPNLPEKSVKILNDRLQFVWKQIQKCEQLYSR